MSEIRYDKKNPMFPVHSNRGNNTFARLVKFIFNRFTKMQDDMFPIKYYKKGKCSRRKLRPPLEQ
jgi:hypothetical protein